MKSFLREGVLDYLTKPFTAENFERIGQRLAETFPSHQPIPGAFTLDAYKQSPR